MRIIDTNLIIYAFQPQYQYLISLIDNPQSYISPITVIEVLGYHRIQPQEKFFFKTLFSILQVKPITNSIIQKAIDLKQSHKMSLGDALIAATAIENGFDIYTHNTSDFSWIPNLNVIDPII